jgi:hypothetical protein
MGTPTPITITMTFPFQILYRFDSAYRYEELPRGILETKLQELRTAIRICLTCDIGEDIDPTTFKATSSVAIAREENKDWIGVLKLSVTFAARFEWEDITLDSAMFDAPT